MEDVRGRKCSVGQGSSELFCLEVYLTGIKTCMFSHKTCTRPSVLFCLLDFEPLVFEGLQSDKEGGPTSQDTSISNSNVGDGHAGPPPTLYPCNKGKSCFFEADPARLFRDFRLPGALALMVASKLSKRQVAIHGSCPIDLSAFGPNLDLSRSLPRAVSSWGHYTGRVESKDPRGRMVATIELSVSLSCLGAVGAWFQLHGPTATTESSPPPRKPSTSAVVPPRCSPGGAQSHSGVSVDEGVEKVEQRSAPVAGERGRCAFTGEHADTTTPSRGGVGGRLGTQEPGSVSWACEFNPRNGSLTEVVTIKVDEVTGGPVPEHAPEGKLADEGEDAGIASGSAESASWKREQAHGRDSRDHDNPAAAAADIARSSGSTGSSVPVTAAASAAAVPATAGNTLDLEHAAIAPSTPIPAVTSNSELDQTPPPPAIDREKGHCDAKVIETGDEAVGQHDIADRVETEDAPRDAVVLVREAAERVLPGNNKLINAWRPSGLPPELDRGIEFNGWSAAGGSGAEATAGGRHRKNQRIANPDRKIKQTNKNAPPATKKGTTVSARKTRTNCRWFGGNGGTSNGVSLTTPTAAKACKGGKPAQQRRGKAVRRPWGAGPGAGTGSISRESRPGGKAYYRNRRRLPPSRPPRLAPRKEKSPPGPQFFEQFLPTWTSLVAEAAWLRSAGATAGAGSGAVVGGRGEDAADGSCGGGGDEFGGRSYGNTIRAPAPPAERGERVDGATSASRVLRSWSAEHPGHVNVSRAPTCERGNSHPGSVGREWDANGKGSERGGSHRGCGVPAPSLDPSVERVLMDWLKSRINRDGRLVPTDPGDGSKNAPGDLEERWEKFHRRGGSGCTPPASSPGHRHCCDRGQRFHQHEQQEEEHHRRDDGGSGADVQRPVHGREATTGRLYGMFAEALDGLLQKENMAPATDSTGAVEGGDRDRIPPCSRIGWVEVVRRVSAIAEQRGQEPAFVAPGQESRHRPVREAEAEAARVSHGDDRTSHAEGTNVAPPVGGSDVPRRLVHGATGAAGPAMPPPGSMGGLALRPPPIRIESYGQHRPLSPPPRLPPLAGTPHSPPLTSLSPPLTLPKALAASSPRRPPAPAPAPATDPGSPQAPASPRASRWLLDSNDVSRRPRSYADDGLPQGGQVSRESHAGAAGFGGSEEGGGVAGSEDGAAKTDDETAGPFSPGVRCPHTTVVGSRAREEAREVLEETFWAPGAKNELMSPLHTAGACRDIDKAVVHGDGRKEGQEEEGVLILEEYESDFEEEED